MSKATETFESVLTQFASQYAHNNTMILMIEQLMKAGELCHGTWYTTL